MQAVRDGLRGESVTTVSACSGRADWCIAWGPGAPTSIAAMERQRAAGRHFAALDLGYWGRTGPQRHFRLTIDACHPQALLMRDELPAERWESAQIKLRADWNSGGHILLVGMGQKSRDQHQLSAGRWESMALARIRRSLYHGHKVVYRTKGRNRERMPGCETFSALDGTIEKALQGCSLVVCRHSNVAVDAIIAGVPVVCYDGAANAIYNSELTKIVEPVAEPIRLKFLRNLAWWQWRDSEIRSGEMWKWMRTMA